MTAVAAARFVDVALSKTGPLSLSYTQKNLKWIIRDHVLSLFQDFPSLKLNTAPFTHNDGTTVNLLTATGPLLPLPPSTTTTTSTSYLNITIWIQQSYPLYSPLVFLSSSSGEPLTHPYIDPSTGAVTTPYLEMWEHPRSTLSRLTRNLVNVFSFWPPFIGNYSPFSFFLFSGCTAAAAANFSHASKREALDRLVLRMQCDMAVFKAEAEEEIERTAAVQSTLQERSSLADYRLYDLGRERAELRKREREITEETDVVSNWLKANDMSTFPEDRVEEVFEGEDERSGLLMEPKAQDDAIDDVMRALEAAMEEGIVPLDAYLKQVRVLAKEQFMHRSMQMEIMGEQRFIS